MGKGLVAGVGINDVNYKTHEYMVINNKQISI